MKKKQISKTLTKIKFLTNSSFTCDSLVLVHNNDTYVMVIFWDDNVSDVLEVDAIVGVAMDEDDNAYTV